MVTLVSSSAKAGPCWGCPRPPRSCTRSGCCSGTTGSTSSPENKHFEVARPALKEWHKGSIWIESRYIWLEGQSWRLMQRGEKGFGSGWCKIGIYLNVHPCSHLNVEVRYGSTCGFSNRAEASKCGAVPIITDQVENENEFLEKFLERKVLSDWFYQVVCLFQDQGKTSREQWPFLLVVPCAGQLNAGLSAAVAEGKVQTQQD